MLLFIVFYKIEILWFNIDFEFIYLRVAALPPTLEKETTNGHETQCHGLRYDARNGHPWMGWHGWHGWCH